MTLTAVLCEGANSASGAAFDEEIRLRHAGRGANLRLRIENITDPIVRNLRDRACDLVGSRHNIVK